MFVKIINSDRKKSPSISTLLKMSICTRLLNRTKHESSCINVNCTQIKANTKKSFPLLYQRIRILAEFITIFRSNCESYLRQFE